jgi:6-phosphogluconolactonase
MHPEIKTYKSVDQVISELGNYLKNQVNQLYKQNKTFNLALPGGRTPLPLFDYLATSLKDEIKWDCVHFFWIDERCVPSDHLESNFGITNKLLLKKLNIPLSHVHPIVGENHPYLEADRYSTLIHKHFNIFNELPSFDMVILGVGEDGHIASVFPNQIELFNSNRLYEVSFHPDTAQQRITATGKIINNANEVIFLVTGENKATIIKQVIHNGEHLSNIPASLVKPELGKVTWYIDQAAASLLKKR